MDLDKKKKFYDIFQDSNIKKYGFGIEGDIRKLTDDVPVEKSTSWRVLLANPTSHRLFDYQQPMGHKEKCGLSDLVKLHFGM